ncbi:metal-dependent hydrolase [Blattabacterium cuenoti]|uniref:metal-dependent hydrolase n=1 Tax=Blattabacterium cuenoti TaxID=1653831 RepID=UPI00163BCC54|nr:metal-dependent hydrolase [Blattabacterium cuenoti]
MKLTFLYHSTYLLEINKYKLIIDPFFYDKKLLYNNIISKYINNKINYILLTHAHYDHVDDVNFFYKKNPDILLISNYEISSFFEKKGIKTYGINYGSFIEFPFGLLKYVIAIHSSSFLNGTYGGNPGGFLLHTKEKNIYLSGDTSVTYDMKLIPKYGKIDLSVLSIGGTYTMGVEDAIIASELLKCDNILGVHYNTFENIKIDKKKSIEMFYNNGKRLILLNTGESINI